MSVVSLVNQKGGVGKTTLALNLAHALARRGANTILVDFDPQGAIGLSLAGRTMGSKGVADWVDEGGEVSQLIIQTKLKELSILPAGAFEPARAQRVSDRLSEGGLVDLLSELRRTFEIVVLDTPAGLIGITSAAIRASNRVVVPVQAEPLALRTLPHTLDAIALAQADSPHLGSPLLVLTMTDLQDSTALAVAEELWELVPADLILQTTVPRDPAFGRSSAAGVPIGLLHRRPPPVAAVFDHLARELEPHLNLEWKEETDDPIYLLD